MYASTQSGSIQIWMMRSDGADPSPLTDGLGDDYPNANVPTVLLDGSRIVFWAGIEGSYGEIWSMAADGSDVRQITDTPGRFNSDDPHPSPDGESIIFASARQGGAAMFMVDADGGERTPFPNPTDRYRRCSWQPLPLP